MARSKLQKKKSIETMNLHELMGEYHRKYGESPPVCTVLMIPKEREKLCEVMRDVLRGKREKITREEAVENGWTLSDDLLNRGVLI